MDDKTENLSNETLIPFENEISTQDALPFSENKSNENTHCFNTSKRKNKRGCASSFFRIVSTTALFLTIILSATDIFDFIMKDLEVETTLIRRVFGQSALNDKNTQKLSDMIMELVFFDLSSDADKTAPSTSAPLSPSETKQEGFTDAPFETSPSAPSDSTATERPPISDTAEPPPDSQNTYPIVYMDLSLLSYGAHYIYNDTSLDPDIEQLTAANLPLYYSEEKAEPLVLVIHSHATESFMEAGATHYTDEGELARSKESHKNMISIGSEFVSVLVNNGIPTLHCVVLHDEESYRLSYQRSEESIKKFLEEYPSIKYVFDLHRDSIVRSNGELVAGVSMQDGVCYGQVMPVVGSGFDGYEVNLAFALQLRQRLNLAYTNLCRPICLRESTYNQNMSAVSILIEIGTSGNTLDDAKRSAALVAEAVASIIKGQ